MVRDDRKLVVVQGATTKPVVRIFTAAGEALAAFVWDHGRIAGMGWSNQEDLLIVDDHGEVRFRTCRPIPPLCVAWMARWPNHFAACQHNNLAGCTYSALDGKHTDKGACLS